MGERKRGRRVEEGEKEREEKVKRNLRKKWGKKMRRGVEERNGEREGEEELKRKLEEGKGRSKKRSTEIVQKTKPVGIEEDCLRIYCDEPCSASTCREEWIECSACKQWANYCVLTMKRPMRSMFVTFVELLK